MGIDCLIKEIRYHSELMEKAVSSGRYLTTSEEAFIIAKLSYVLAIFSEMDKDNSEDYIR